MSDECAFCIDDGAMANDLHPSMPMAMTWADSKWRLFADLTAEADGISLLAPRRHVRNVSDLDPDEAATLGTVLGRLTSALQEETQAETVYLYVFDHSHLHIHLAPHQPGDALSSQIVKASQVVRAQGGLHLSTSTEYPPLPTDTLLQTASRVRDRLRGPELAVTR